MIPRIKHALNVSYVPLTAFHSSISTALQFGRVPDEDANHYVAGVVDDAVDTMSDLDLAEHIAYLRKERGGNSAGMALSDSYFTKRYAKEDVEDAKCAMLKADRLTRRLRSEAQAGRPGPTGRRV